MKPASIGSRPESHETKLMTVDAMRILRMNSIEWSLRALGIVPKV